MEKLQILNQFWERLSHSEHAALLLDYDGTLAPFREERDKAVPYPGVRELLTTISRETATRLVIISGRAIDDLLPLLGLDPPPEVWGCHGWEQLREDGYRPALRLPVTAKEGLQKAASWVSDHDLDKYCEQKPVSLAIHWRGLADKVREKLRHQVNTGWNPLAKAYNLELHPFDGGLELRCPGRDKGTAIREIKGEFAPHTVVAFLGDDLTDEDAFAEMEEVGLGILVRDIARSTRAHLRISPPEELLEFLHNWRMHAPVSRKGGSCKNV